MSLVDEFKWRGVLAQASEGLDGALDSTKVKAYIGFDPTAASLHVGSLLPVLNLARLQRHGHTPIGIVGGGTGMIGDPSGKSVERQLLTREMVDANLAGIHSQLERFLDFGNVPNRALLVNNADWLSPMGLLDFLRDVGKHFTVNYMLGKESVRRRLDAEDGVSVTEFSYMLLQAYDFLELYDRFGCTLQMGGTDQWGNITAGMDLIRKVRGKQAHGMVFPLVTSATGQKFGKSETGTIWLDGRLTSPFRFYQFWLNTGDQDVVSYLKYFTSLPVNDVEELAQEVVLRPEDRRSQRVLATEVTQMIHGVAATEQAEKASAALFDGDFGSLTASLVRDAFDGVPALDVTSTDLDGGAMTITELAIRAGFAAGKAEVRRLVEQGGLYMNNRRIQDAKAPIVRSDMVDGSLAVLRKGAKTHCLVRVVA